MRRIAFYMKNGDSLESPPAPTDEVEKLAKQAERALLSPAQPAVIQLELSTGGRAHIPSQNISYFIVWAAEQ